MVETWIIDGVRYTTEPTEWSYDELEQQRTELLEALKDSIAVLEYVEEWAITTFADTPAQRLKLSYYKNYRNAIDNAKQALAKAEGDA